MSNVQRIFGALVAAACLPWSIAVAQDTVTCADCHSDEAEELADSIHRALGCQQCHGGQTTYPEPTELAAFDHGPSFTGKPKRTDVPATCGTCHADVERMNPYGIPTDQLARYWTSGHGKTLKQTGDVRVAVCIDCHGAHDVLSASDPAGRTHPLNVPDTCATCHGDSELMSDFDLPSEIVDEYTRSVHGRLLLEQGDTGAPTCATCHGNHSAMPPGFATVGAVCGKCHMHAATNFATSIHATLPEHKGCIQCHGGGEGTHSHLIERITQPTGIMIQRYKHLLASDPSPSPERITEAIHPDPKKIITQALPTCTECHEDIEDDESLPKLFVLLDEIAAAERYYVETARRLNEIGQGVLLVDTQRFEFENAKTLLIGLAPLQHTLDNQKVSDQVAELNAVCDQVNAELNELENGLQMRYRLLLPIWGFSLVFAVALYAKYKQLKAIHVRPLPKPSGGEPTP